MGTSSHQFVQYREASALSATRLSTAKRLSIAHVSTFIIQWIVFLVFLSFR